MFVFSVTVEQEGLSYKNMQVGLKTNNKNPKLASFTKIEDCADDKVSWQYCGEEINSHCYFNSKRAVNGITDKSRIQGKQSKLYFYKAILMNYASKIMNVVETFSIGSFEAWN